jgi:hypothetical protein
MRLVDQLPIEIIFNILSAQRRRWGDPSPTIRAAIQKRRLHSLAFEPEKTQRPLPRLPFWIRLCQSASLLDEDAYPTLLADEWLGWPFYKQMTCLVEAWRQVPSNKRFLKVRTDLLMHLVNNLELGVAHRQELIGLQALGICDGERLSPLGLDLLSGSNQDQFKLDPPGLWSIAGDRLTVPFPPDWGLLWELEKYLDFITSTVQDIVSGADESIQYFLNPPTLRLAAQRGALDSSPTLPRILECGLAEPLPVKLLHQLAKEPTIRLIPGFVLEFSHPEELKRLRQFPGLRRHLDHLLSPRHVVLDPYHSPQIFQRLHQKGLLSERDLDSVRSIEQPGICPPRLNTNPTRLARSEQAYLLSLVLLVEGLQKLAVPPPGLLNKLTEGMSASLQAAAACQAAKTLNQIHPQPAWQPDGSSPAAPPEALIWMIQSSIDRCESVDVSYQSSGQHTPEIRHLTPLLLEPRGERYFLIAYCHTRRANRTFRLDRLKLLLK